MNIISLGWGTQSFGLTAMSALGELPPVDAAIHADTGHERTATYEFAARWTPWLQAHGMRVVTVRPRDVSADPVDAYGGVMVPAYGDGAGQFQRQCTTNWKVQPIRRWLQAHRNSATVRQWIGISLDEAQRIRDSDVRYIENAYPLLGIGVDAPGGQPWHRRDVVRWLQEHGLEVPPRSACVFCPFQSNHEWAYLQRHAPADWAAAVAADEQIRNVRLPGQLFLHQSRRPLAGLDFTSQQELDLWPGECSGLCGV